MLYQGLIFRNGLGSSSNKRSGSHSVIVHSYRGEHLPIVGPGIVLLDTAVALSIAGRLTAFCPDNESYIQSDRWGDTLEQKL